jgi:putative ABC transport system permease protein
MKRRAHTTLGGAEQIKEEVRDIRLGATVESIAAELRQCLRGLWRSPGLAILCTVMLALGMGAGTVVFSIFYSVLLRPLPLHDSGRVSFQGR